MHIQAHYWVWYIHLTVVLSTHVFMLHNFHKLLNWKIFAVRGFETTFSKNETGILLALIIYKSVVLKIHFDYFEILVNKMIQKLPVIRNVYTCIHMYAYTLHKYIQTYIHTYVHRACTCIYVHCVCIILYTIIHYTYVH